jgi:hypothetical protein
MSEPVTVTHNFWLDIRKGHKKSLFNRWAEEARKLAGRAVAAQAKAVASSESGQYHRHVKVHTSATKPDAGVRAMRSIGNIDNGVASEIRAKTITEPLRGCQHDGHFSLTLKHFSRIMNAPCAGPHSSFSLL